jgi:hypothetical protein
MDTGRYETCLFDESRIRATVAAATGVTGDLWPRHSEVIATYGTDADAAERGHRMIAAALRFTIAPEGDND